jgi:APA family basic amino acid/polyamine antiporter
VLWGAVGVNLRGIVLYERLVVPLMFLTLLLGACVIVAGFSFDHGDYASRVIAAAGNDASEDAKPIGAATLLSASALLFASFIGFDSIAQAGGEARNPGRDLPLAIALAVGLVAAFYMLFTAPGLLGPLLPPFWTIVIVSAAAVALVKDLPPMLLSVSRLMFAWAEDGIVPAAVARVHPSYRTPHVAVLLSGAMASLSILGCHLAGDFFLGIDILVFAMLVNFFLMAVTVLTLPRVNPAIDRAVTVLPSRRPRAALAATGAAVLALYLVVHAVRDLSAPVPWHMRSTFLWAVVLAVGSIIYAREMRTLRRRGVDVEERFAALPPD